MANESTEQQRLLSEHLNLAAKQKDINRKKVQTLASLLINNPEWNPPAQLNEWDPATPYG